MHAFRYPAGWQGTLAVQWSGLGLVAIPISKIRANSSFPCDNIQTVVLDSRRATIDLIPVRQQANEAWIWNIQQNVFVWMVTLLSACGFNHSHFTSDLPGPTLHATCPCWSWSPFPKTSHKTNVMVSLSLHRTFCWWRTCIRTRGLLRSIALEMWMSWMECCWSFQLGGTSKHCSRISKWDSNLWNWSLRGLTPES